MFLPPTMLPNSLRVLVDPPRRLPGAREETPRAQTAVRPGRWATVEPRTPRTLQRKANACTD